MPVQQAEQDARSCRLSNRHGDAREKRVFANGSVILEDRPGALAEIGETLGRAGVSIEGGGMFVVDGKGVANFLVDDGTAGWRALKAAGLDVVREDAVVIQRWNQDEPGQLGKLLRKMAQAGVNVLTQYSDHNHQLVLVVDNLRAAQDVSDAWMQERSVAEKSNATAPTAKKRLHHYAVRVAWTGNTGSGTSSYASYRREHDISAPEKATISGSSDPAFRGDSTRYNPEDLLVASASACHMLAYLHLCAVNGVVVLSYEDRPERSGSLNHRVRSRLSFPKQIRLILAQLAGAELIRWTFEIARQVFDCLAIGAYRTLRVITVLEFLDHHFSEMGHRDFLVTRHYPSFHTAA